jgi:predicted N-acetyltransferase YhbS
MSLKVSVRLLRPADLDAIVSIDEKVTGTARPEYYEHKFRMAGLHEGQINASLVAEENHEVIGFLMGSVCYGDCGIPETSAVLDTLGVDPAYQDRGVGGLLFDRFLSHMKAIQIDKIYTSVDWKDFGLLKFFGHMGFVPSQRMNLECPVPAPPRAR